LCSGVNSCSWEQCLALGQIGLQGIEPLSLQLEDHLSTTEQQHPYNVKSSNCVWIALNLTTRAGPQI
ncbi:hypothetical protein AMECASPLE_009974, partial [Ameca splendens]